MAMGTVKSFFIVTPATMTAKRGPKSKITSFHEGSEISQKGKEKPNTKNPTNYYHQKWYVPVHLG